jgi:hypothetical protein
MPARFLTLLGGLALCLLLTLAVPGDVRAHASDDAPDALRATHTVTITYARGGRGALRTATVTITPREAGARPTWQGAPQSIYLQGLRKGESAPIALRQGANGAFTGTGLVPAPGQLAYMVLRTDRRQSVAVRLPAARGDDPAPAPDPEPEPDPEPSDDCTPDGPCSGIVDPWTCECHSDLKDPWEFAASGQSVSFGF